MYKIDKVSKYPFFSFDEIDLCDSLTGVLNRKYTIEYIKTLIEKKYPFSLLFLDVDNFKLINDNYGHNIGDEVLSKLGTDLINYVGEKGIVGRFGGDEFLIVYFGEYDYDAIHRILDQYYYPGEVLRKTYYLSSIEPFITATIGNVSYPKDGPTYDILFTKLDKALYRGKMKGRNCYIIYSDKKHANIDVNSSLVPPLYQQLYELNGILMADTPANEKMRLASKYLIDTIRMSKALILLNDELIASVTNGLDDESITFSILSSINYSSNVFVCNDIDTIENAYPRLYQAAVNDGIVSFLTAPIYNGNEIMGFVIFAEDKMRRIWQGDDEALITFFSIGISHLINKRKKTFSH